MSLFGFLTAHFWAIYLTCALIMMIIAVVIQLVRGQLRLSDVLILPLVGALSFFGMFVILMALLCHGLEMIMDETGRNRVLWQK